MSFPCSKPSSGSHLTQNENRLASGLQGLTQQVTSDTGPCSVILPSPSHHLASAPWPSRWSSDKQSTDLRAFAPAVLCARNALPQRSPWLTSYLLTLPPLTTALEKAAPQHTIYFPLCICHQLAYLIDLCCLAPP